MRRTIYQITICLLFAFTAGAQEIITSVTNPFFNSEYCPATLYSTSAHIYRGLKIKLDLESGQIKFIKENSDEIELTISFQVKKIEFGDCGKEGKNAVFQTGFPVVNSQQDKGTFYQVLDSGKTMLLKGIAIIEKKPDKTVEYGAKDVLYDKHESYFLYSPASGMTRTGRSKSAILKSLEDKRIELDGFITANNIRFRTDEEFARVVAFYNSLP